MQSFSTFANRKRRASLARSQAKNARRTIPPRRATVDPSPAQDWQTRKGIASKPSPGFEPGSTSPLWGR
jgi:hypothetical protein